MLIAAIAVIAIVGYVVERMVAAMWEIAEMGDQDWLEGEQ